MGRKPKPVDEVKRHPIGFRTTKALFDRIHQAAEASQRSIAQEVEARLEHGFAAEDYEIQNWGSLDNSALFHLTAAAIHLAERQTGKQWRLDEATRTVVRSFFSNALETLAVPGPADDEKTRADVLHGLALAGQIEAQVLSSFRRAKLAGWEDRAKAASQAAKSPNESD
jgi:hypothetical protein